MIMFSNGIFTTTTISCLKVNTTNEVDLHLFIYKFYCKNRLRKLRK